MPNTAAKILILVMAGFFVFWDWHTVQNKKELQPQNIEFFRACFIIAAILTLCLCANALAFVQHAFVSWEMDSQTEIWTREGTFAGFKADRLDLIIDQVNLFVGVGYPMWLIHGAVAFNHEDKDKLTKANVLHVIEDMLKRLIINYWWSLIGLGTFFGVTSGIGMIFFLFIELVIMWGVIKIGSIFVKNNKLTIN